MAFNLESISLTAGCETKWWYVYSDPACRFVYLWRPSILSFDGSCGHEVKRLINCGAGALSVASQLESRLNVILLLSFVFVLF